MNKPARKVAGSPRERIMSVATELFYRQGYRATGINEVIQKSGVAKATFYSHFPSKDDLGMAYLTYLKESEIAEVDQAIRMARDPVSRFLAVIRSLAPWAVDTDFRGCGFLNMASEVPDPKSPLRKVGRDLYDEIRSRVERLSKELIASDPKKYKSFDARELTHEYMVIFVGAVALAEVYHAIWPVEHALDAARRLIGQTTG